MMTLPAAVAAALRLRRQELGLTAATLAARLSIEPTAVTKAERHPGRFGMSLAALDRWTQALDWAPSDAMLAAQRLRRKDAIRVAALRMALGPFAAPAGPPSELTSDELRETLAGMGAPVEKPVTEVG